MTSKRPPTTETKSVSEARKTFSETLNRVYRGETRVLIEKNGIPVGVIVPPYELAALELIEEKRRLARKAFAEARKGFEGIPPEEIEREVEKAIAEVEEERRQARQKKSA